jgi:hypothetical protein
MVKMEPMDSNRSLVLPLHLAEVAAAHMPMAPLVHLVAVVTVAEADLIPTVAISEVVQRKAILEETAALTLSAEVVAERAGQG